MIADALLILHSMLTWLFCGILWFVQLIHYPMARGNIGAFEREHTRNVMAPAVTLLILELATGVTLLFFRPDVPAWMLWLNTALIAGIWMVTWLWCVPCHRAMCASGSDLLARLLRANGWRVMLASAHAVLCAAMLALIT